MPSPVHALLAYVVPKVRGAGEPESLEQERGRLVAWHADLDRRLPTRLVPRFAQRYAVATDRGRGFPVHTVRRRGTTPRTRVLYLHGGGYVAPTDAFHVRYALRLARHLDAEVVLPDYPLAPEHTWRASHDALADLLADLTSTGDRVVVAGDSAGGGLALAVTMTVRDRGAALPSELVLLSPWVDLTTSTPESYALDRHDPWLSIRKLDAYAAWWAGSTPTSTTDGTPYSTADLARPEVSPALGDLTGLPPTLVFCGTRDVLVPGCRLLALRALAAGWPLTYVEEPGLIHVYPLLPIPEARRAWHQTKEHLS